MAICYVVTQVKHKRLHLLLCMLVNRTLKRVVQLMCINDGAQNTYERSQGKIRIIRTVEGCLYFLARIYFIWKRQTANVFSLENQYFHLEISSVKMYMWRFSNIFRLMGFINYCKFNCSHSLCYWQQLQIASKE